MYEIEAFVLDTGKESRIVGSFDCVPPHVRQDRRSKLFHNAWPFAYAFGVDSVFESVFEHHLETDADSENWTTTCEARVDKLWTANRSESIHARGKGPDAGNYQTICLKSCGVVR
jgi:hypothetical protein